jgi:ABC-type glycerol-3-phosphate transport system substrate-binding protein
MMSAAMSNRHVLRAVVAAMLVAIAVAACGASSDPLASHRPDPSATEAPTPFPHGARDLEARLPSSIAGTPLTRYSYDGQSFLATGNEQNRTQLTKLLAQLGRQPTDLTIAQASDPRGYLTFQEGIFRVAGTSPDVLEPAWVASQEQATQGKLVETKADIGGLKVTKLVDAQGGTAAATYIVPRGDSLVLIRAIDPNLVQEAIAQLH